MENVNVKNARIGGRLGFSFEKEIEKLSENRVSVLVGCQVGEICFDGGVFCRHRLVGLFQYALNNENLLFQKIEIPKLMKQLRLPFGIILSQSGSYLAREGEDGGIAPFQKVTNEDIIQSIEHYVQTVSKNPDIEHAKKELLRRFDESPSFENKSELRKTFVSVLGSLTYNEFGDLFFNDLLNDEFIYRLIGGEIGKKVCRYTSMDSFFQLIERGSQNMCSFVSMNDPNEGRYAESWMSWKMVNWRDEPKIDLENRYYLLSCSKSEMIDDLTMWRLYGDDAQGVCIVYDIQKELNKDWYFYIAPVNYGLSDGSHPQLELINSLQTEPVEKGWHFCLTGWGYWKYFFKAYHYSVEKEIRLVCVSCNEEADGYRQWYKDRSNGIFSHMVQFPITMGSKSFPLTISKIILGPKSPCTRTNMEQIKLMMEDKGFLCDDVCLSSISNYR